MPCKNAYAITHAGTTQLSVVADAVESLFLFIEKEQDSLSDVSTVEFDELFDRVSKRIDLRRSFMKELGNE
jgi:hypothetical protein